MSLQETEREWPIISIIIVNFNGRKWLKGLFESVLASDYPEDKLEIVLVDNDSSDRSVDYVKLGFGNDARLRIIALNKNYGFTEGNNIGSRYTNKEARYIVFLNPDTQVDENWLKELVSAMESDHTVGMAQSLLLDYYNRQVIQCAGLYMIDFCGWTWALSRGLSYDQFAHHFSQPIEIFAAMGAAMIIRRDLFYSIGCLILNFSCFPMKQTLPGECGSWDIESCCFPDQKSITPSAVRMNPKENLKINSPKSIVTRTL